MVSASLRDHLREIRQRGPRKLPGCTEGTGVVVAKVRVSWSLLPSRREKSSLARGWPAGAVWVEQLGFSGIHTPRCGRIWVMERLGFLAAVR